MSSTYSFLCLSHDPAVGIGHDAGLDGVEVSAVRNLIVREQAFGVHQDCDLAIGRWSGALVEVGCLGRAVLPSAACQGYHNDIIWADKDWLRLLHAAQAVPLDAKLLCASSFRCWPPRRLYRLRIELALPGTGVIEASRAAS